MLSTFAVCMTCFPCLNLFVKGPVLAWLKVIEAFQALNIEIPVNIKVCCQALSLVVYFARHIYIMGMMGD